MNLPPCVVTPARSALVGLAIVGLIACGSGEPATDAERLARGRELVQQMSARLAGGDRGERDDDRNARRGAWRRARRSGCR